jgi:hypothetical protein
MAGRAGKSGDDIEDIVEVTTLPLVQHHIVNRHHATTNVDDPLKEFYAKARAACESKVCDKNSIHSGSH